MDRHFFGQTSTQLPHWMHCMRWISQVLPARSTVIALAGHFLMHIPQRMHWSLSISMWPRVRAFQFFVMMGWSAVIFVAGFLNRLLRTTFPILNVAITLTYLSVQLMQGSMVRTTIGTSARSQP